MAAGSPAVKLQVQLCVYGEAGMKRLLEAAHPRVPGVEWLVSWQMPSGPVPDALAQRSDIQVIETQTRGLSVNRNIALDHPSTTPYILIGDDDVDYSASALQELIEAFERHPQAAIICGRYTCHGRYTKPYPERESTIADAPFGWYPTSFEIALRRSSLGSVRFHSLLGIGAPRLVAGEEDALLEALRRRGVGGLIVPITIGAHNQPTTGERMEADPRFLFTRGAVTTYLHPRTWPLRLAAHALRAPQPTVRYLRHALDGALYALRSGLFRGY